MRIRKTASKVLGLSSSFRHEDSDSEYHCAAAPPEELLLCQLNCSPWDVLDLDSNLHHFTFQDGGEGGDEGRGIMGNGFKFEDYEEILANAEEAAAFTSFGSSAAVDEAELNSEEDGNGDDKKATKKKKKKRRRRKRKEEVIINVIRDEDKVVATKNSSISITYCKKNDGKGWQCKRPAKRQHSLCDHHLDLLRNYSSRTNSRESYELEADQVKNQRPKAVAVAAAAESAGDGFYYYSGFGPWRGKKRSSGTIADHARPKEAASDDEDDDDDDDEKGEERKDESGDGSDAPVAGDDLDDDTNDEEDGIENKGRYNKKGRKRVKARSLKSLM